jgi:two-component system chemotaxis response regulator CheY
MRALVVDDSRAMRMILSRVLRDLGADVVEASDGQEALAALAVGPQPDVALVDWNMPVMNGLEFVTAVRREAGLGAMRLVMVTTESESTEVVRALEAGADEYLFKPFTPEAVVDKLALLGLATGV